MLLSALIGGLLLQFAICRIDNTEDVKVGKEVECVVVEKAAKYTNRFLVKDIKIDGKKYDFCAYLNCDQNTDYNFFEGNIIKFTIKSFYEYPLFRDDADIISADLIEDKIKYNFSTDNIEQLSNKTTVRCKVKTRIKSILSRALNSDNAELMYSALLGDKTELSKDLYSNYQMSGVAHVLAVSGLHVGLIVMILKKILQRLKANKYAILCIIVAFLIGYSYLCNWSYSVLRASIMAIVVVLAPLFFREYDFLSSISFAGIIILFVSPYALFDVSFVLSFMSVLGICILFPIIHKWLKNHKKCNWFTESLGISVATNLAILVPSVYYFRSFNPIGVLSNIIVLPLFSFIFTGTFVILCVSLVLPFAGYLLYLFNPLISLLNLITSIISSYSFSFDANKVKFLSIVVYGVVLMFASKFNIKSGVSKVFSIVVMLAIFAIQLSLGFAFL